MWKMVQFLSLLAMKTYRDSQDWYNLAARENKRLLWLKFESF